MGLNKVIYLTNLLSVIEAPKTYYMTFISADLKIQIFAVTNTHLLTGKLKDNYTKHFYLKPIYL